MHIVSDKKNRYTEHKLWYHIYSTLHLYLAPKNNKQVVVMTHNTPCSEANYARTLCY